jgi:hypothetical protein
MTDCHQPAGVRPLQIVTFRTGMSPVTGSEAVTRKTAVTRETIASQGKSSLSPVSPLKSLPLYIRAIRVWGCHLSPVTVVTGDKPPSAPASRSVATRLSQLSQLARRCGGRPAPGRGLKRSQASTDHRCHSAVRTETKNRKKWA